MEKEKNINLYSNESIMNAKYDTCDVLYNKIRFSLSQKAFDENKEILSFSIDKWVTFNEEDIIILLKDLNLKIVSEDLGGTAIFKSSERLFSHAKVIIYANNSTCLCVTKCCDKDDVNNSVFFHFLTIEQKNMNIFVKFSLTLKQFINSKPKDVYMITQDTGRHYSFETIGSIDKKINRENYDKSVIDGYDYIVKNIQNKNAGRLVILSGPPGSGKSYFIRGLINEIQDVKFVLLQSNLLCSLDQPTIIPLLIANREEDKPFVFVIEDADNYLVSRSADNMTSISSLLNFCDGLFGSFINLKIIATTNAHELDVDEALKRPGRLLLHQKIDLLEPEQANEIYKSLEGNANFSFNKSISLAEIYAKALGSKIEKKEAAKKLGFC